MWQFVLLLCCWLQDEPETAVLSCLHCTSSSFWRSKHVTYGSSHLYQSFCMRSVSEFPWWGNEEFFLFLSFLWQWRVIFFFPLFFSFLNQTFLKYSFIHLVVCLTTGPKPLPKWALHIVQSRASSFKWEYPLLSLRSSNSFLCLLPCLPVTSIPPCTFPSVTHCRR